MYDSKPTILATNKYQQLFDYFNSALFSGTLKNCFLTMIPRRSNVCGHFSPDRWSVEGKKLHEISMNPHFENGKNYEFWCQTLVHEMCHLWIYLNVHQKTTYHCKAWADQMITVGLQPSDTGEPGGKTTGKRMSDYVIVGGAFEKAFKKIPKEILLLINRLPSEKAGSKKNTKLKYICHGCDQVAWGKEGLNIGCIDCNEQLIQQ